VRQVNTVMEDQVGFHATVGDHGAATQLRQPRGRRYRTIHRDLPCSHLTRGPPFGVVSSDMTR
jgi:hypothetical protein